MAGLGREWLEIPFGDFWIPAALALLILRTFAFARNSLVRIQTRFIPRPNLYTDLFASHKPDLVIVFDGRLAAVLLPAAGSDTAQYTNHGCNRRLGQPIEVGLRHPRAADELRHSLVTTPKGRSSWSYGSDWNPEHVHIGGIPSYDGYFRKQWQLSKEEYFKLHGLDPNRKLISYAAFVHFAPNYPNVEALAKLVSSDSLAEPSHLLIRLHPSHFQDKPKIFAEERARIFALEKQYPNVHVVKPVALGGSLGYYGGEDMDEKSSMMAHSDVLVTVYSTMVVRPPSMIRRLSPR